MKLNWFHLFHTIISAALTAIKILRWFILSLVLFSNVNFSECHGWANFLNICCLGYMTDSKFYIPTPTRLTINFLGWWLRMKGSHLPSHIPLIMITWSQVARYISTSAKLLSIQHGMGHPLTKSFLSYTYRMLRDKLKTLYLQFYMFCKNQIWCSSDLE